MKTSWKRLEKVFHLRLQKTPSRRLDQDDYTCLSHIHSEDIFKNSWSRPKYLSSSYVLKTFSKTSLAKRSSRHLQDAFKTLSRHLQDILQRCLQDVFKTDHQVKMFLLTHLRDVFNTFLKHIAKMVIYRRIFLVHTSEKLMISVQNSQEW